jgi:hypothetical protein
LTINFGFVDSKFVVGKLGGIDLVLLFGKSRELNLGFMFCYLANWEVLVWFCCSTNQVGSNLVVFYFLANKKGLVIGYGFVNFGFVVQ